MPDMEQKQDMSLYNLEVKYKFDKKINVSFIMKNIFNQDVFVEKTDFNFGYKQNIYEIKQSYWLLRFNYNF